MCVQRSSRTGTWSCYNFGHSEFARAGSLNTVLHFRTSCCGSQCLVCGGSDCPLGAQQPFFTWICVTSHLRGKLFRSALTWMGSHLPPPTNLRIFIEPPLISSPIKKSPTQDLQLPGEAIPSIDCLQFAAVRLKVRHFRIRQLHQLWRDAAHFAQPRLHWFLQLLLKRHMGRSFQVTKQETFTSDWKSTK